MKKREVPGKQKAFLAKGSASQENLGHSSGQVAFGDSSP